MYYICICSRNCNSTVYVAYTCAYVLSATYTTVQVYMHRPTCRRSLCRVGLYLSTYYEYTRLAVPPYTKFPLTGRSFNTHFMCLISPFPRFIFFLYDLYRLYFFSSDHRSAFRPILPSAILQGQHSDRQTRSRLGKTTSSFYSAILLSMQAAFQLG